MTSGGLGGFKFQGDFSSVSRLVSTIEPVPTQSYSGLDGHTRRITPIPISARQSQQPVSPMDKSPEEIQKGVSELIQKLENEKKT